MAASVCHVMAACVHTFSTSTEGVDYTLDTDTVVLSSAIRTAVIGVSTVDDSIFQEGEFFVASITYGGPLSGVNLSPGQATVIIEDAEGEGYILICMLATKDLHPSFQGWASRCPLLSCLFVWAMVGWVTLPLFSFPSSSLITPLLYLCNETHSC